MTANQYGFDTITLPEGAVLTRELKELICDGLDRGGGELSLAMQTAILRGMEIIGDLEARVIAIESAQ
ncbi:hypothetical protein [Prescottella equi]